MATLKNKVSLQVKSQLPDFVQAENPNFIAFMKAYYEFMESAELKLTSLGSVDSVLLEGQPVGAAATYSNFVILQNPSEYRQEINSVLLEDTPNGAFVNGEIITGTSSRATATIRVEDIQADSRLFISAQSSFIIGETITGATSNATGVISNYTANPVQNIQQLMEYADVDDTIDQFFDQFKEAFLKTIPKKLTAGVNERNLLKNIKDLYRSKGTRKGHELFFRILLNEDPILYYPRQDMLRVSDGNWSEDSILRVTLGDDTILMEDASPTAGDIYILDEYGGQIKTEDSIIGTSDLLKLVGQEITQAVVTDRSILPGGAYDVTNQAARGLASYSVIGKATALIDSIASYFYLGEQIFELVLNIGSTIGTFATGHTITATANDDDDVTLSGKLVSILADYDVSNSTSSQYYNVTDTLSVTALNGNSATAKIDSLTSGDINSIMVDAGGSGYEIGDTVTVNNSNTNGAALAAQVAIVNGSIAPEAGDLVGEWGIELEAGGGYGAGDILLDDGIPQEVDGSPNPLYNGEVSLEGSVKQQEAYDMLAIDHIILENYTVFNDGIAGNKIAQESGTGNGDVTDIVITIPGVGYTKTPLLTLPTTGLRTGATIYAKGTDVGKIRDVTILDAGAHYTDPLFPNLSRMGTLGYKIQIDATTNFLYTDISGNFILDETVTGATSGATGIYKSVDASRNVIKLADVTGTFEAGPEKSGEIITGFNSGKTAIIDSYDAVALKGDDGVLGETSGRFLNEDGFLDEKTKKIQDSYYYQDYSYVVKTGSSINIWRDSILASVHPAGWALFGQVDISTAVQAIANITSITGLGPLFKVIYTMLLGRRLGTQEQLPINPNPAVGIQDPADYGNSFRISGSSGTITKGALITGDTSGATATAILDTTNDHGVNLLSYELLAGGDAAGAPGSVLFSEGEDITMSGVYTGTATIVSIYGLRGFRDVTLFHYVKILTPPKYMTGDKYGFHPRLGDADEWKFSYGMVSSAASSRTFSSMTVYPVYLNMLTTITSAINDIVAIIPVAELVDLPTQGTIKLDTEEITYTGKSAASGAGNLTGGTRGTNGTTPASHLINTNLTLVRLARSQTGASGYRIQDWATDWRGVPLTIGDIATYPQRKNNISAPTEITMWKT